ncbi:MULTISPECIES: hypothetical protein [unclassified Methylophilus]|uniref:hypothetical protein n=1 Tax=unclassified Methylophilus TaxID=2630143 RepID=UPI00036067AB|nr:MULTISPECIES: hypothetical protein [unclassified Methylophilus]
MPSIKFVVRFVGRSILVVVIALAIALIATEISDDYFVNQYMLQHHITDRAELADDFAFGLEGLGQVLATFIISFTVSIITACGLLWRFRWRNQPIKK